MSRRTALWILLAIVVAGVSLRSYQLTARSLWFDEAFSWRLIQFPFNEMLARDAADVHPPLYYIVLRGWSIVFGTSLLSLRSLSVVGAGLTIAAAYVFAASAWHSRAPGLLAAAMIALSGWQISFAWEARMYTLGTLLALVASWLLLRAVRANKVVWWLGYALAAAAFAYVHYFALFTLAAHALFMVGLIVVRTRGRIGEITQSRTLWLALLAGVIAIGLYSPWLPTFLAQNRQVQTAFWVPPIGGWSIPDTFYRFWWPTAGTPAHTGLRAVISALPLAATLVVWVWLLLGGASRTKDADWLVGLAGLVPLVLTIVISLAGQSLYQDRFLVFANIFILVGAAALIGRLNPPWVRTAVGVVVVIGLAVGFIRFWQELDITHRPGARAASRYVFTQRQNDEPVLVSSPFIYFAIKHYGQEEFQAGQTVRLYSESAQLIHFAGGPILTPDDIVSTSFVETSQLHTVWMIDTSGFGGRPAQLSSEWRRDDQQLFPEVFSYQGQVAVTKYVRDE